MSYSSGQKNVVSKLTKSQLPVDHIFFDSNLEHTSVLIYLERGNYLAMAVTVAAALSHADTHSNANTIAYFCLGDSGE